MKPCKDIRSSFTAAIYNDLDAEAKIAFREHLNACEKCRKRYRRMKRTLRVMSQRVRQEPALEFWDGYWDRLQNRMERENVVPRRNWKPWIYRVAAVIILIGIGVIAGRYYRPQDPGGPIAKAPATAPEIVQPAKLDQRTADFLGRSEVLLLGLVNFNPEDEEAAAIDLPKQKEISRGLIQEASFLKKEFSDQKDRRLEKLVTDLELILLQITNLEEQEDLPEIELVKSGVDRKGLLLKINLEQMKSGQPSKDGSRGASGKPGI